MRNDRQNARMLLRIARTDERTFLLLGQQGNELLRQACFHAQQAVEKALKAVLAVYGIPVRKTHDLEEIYGNFQSPGVVCPIDLDELVQLTPYAALFRYDDTDIPQLDLTVARSVVARTLEWATSQIEE